MSYSAEISRQNPACIVFLVDQSLSMDKPFGAQPDKRKADGVADAINRLLQTLCIKCGRADGIREFFVVGVIGYGATVKSALGGPLAGRGLVPIGELARSPIRVETRTRHIPDGAGGIVPQALKFPVWFEPVANGKTPMTRALELASGWVRDFVAKYPSSFPPMIINLTDGAADDDPSDAAETLKSIRSSDGSVLLFNLHASARPAAPIMFPHTETSLPDELAKRLFRLSSPLPDRFLEVARSEQISVQNGSRGFAFNADLVAVIRFLDIGTRLAPSAGN